MLQTLFDFGMFRPSALGIAPELLGYALLILACVLTGGVLTFFRRRWDTAVTPVILLAVAGLVLIRLPADAGVALRVYGYGLMMVLGFIFGIALARWRARRAGQHPDTMTYCGVLALVGGVAGARIAFVIEQWNSEFSHAPNLLMKIVDISSGGLIYYGGVVLATAVVLVYLRVKHLPLRRFLDILAPSLMIGLAFGRAGCLLNGCCWGGPCRADWPLATRFPMYSQPLLVAGDEAGPFSAQTDSPSPVYSNQLDRRARTLAAAGTPDSPERLESTPSPGLVHPDARLVQRFYQISIPAIDDDLDGPRVPRLILHAPVNLHGPLTTDQTATLVQTPAQAREAFAIAAGSDGKLSEREWREALSAGDGFLRGSEHWDDATLGFDTSSRDGLLSFDEAWQYLQARRAWLTRRFGSAGGLDTAAREKASEYLQADTYALAAESWSLPVKPAQALGLVNALLLAGILAVFYRYRRREGQCFALLMILYPITRFVLESIRSDNPHNLLKFQLTHNQYTSMAVVVAGLALWWALTRMRPASLQSPAAATASKAPAKGKTMGA